MGRIHRFIVAPLRRGWARPARPRFQGRPLGAASAPAGPVLREPALRDRRPQRTMGRMNDSSRRPNVLMILADQHNARLMGCAGHPHAITPNLDRIAAEGVRLPNAITQNTLCTPARVSILSGQYCHNHGYYALVGPSCQTPPSLFAHFKARGYRTAGIGKLHLPDNPRDWIVDDCDLWADIHRPPEAGKGLSPYQQYLADHGLTDVDDSRTLRDVKVRGDHDSRPSNMPFEHCVDTWITDRATEFMADGDDGRPFFMQVSYPRPHHGITPDRRFWDMYPDDLDLPPTLTQDCSHRPWNFQEMVRYLREEHAWGYEPKTFEEGSRRVWRGTLAAITQVDFCIGRLLEALEAAGQLDNTIILYSSDHGAYHGLHGIMEKAPGICSDAVCRVPMLWRGPGLAAGHVAGEWVEHVDIATTLPGLCGLEPMETTDGRDIAGLLRGEGGEVRPIAVTELPWSKAVYWGKYRFVQYHRRMYDGADVGELYDMEADPAESTNLYHRPEMQPVVAECRRLLLEWLTETQRFVTAWPVLPEDQPAMRGRQPFALGGDGTAPNRHGIAARLSHGTLSGFRVIDYL